MIVSHACVQHPVLPCFCINPFAAAAGCIQACIEFFPVLLTTRAAYKALKAQQPALFSQLFDNGVNSMVLAPPEGWAGNLQL